MLLSVAWIYECNLINTMMEMIFSIQSTVIVNTIRNEREKVQEHVRLHLSFSLPYFIHHHWWHRHSRMRRALIEKRVWKNLSHRWNIIMYYSCHYAVWNMISMKIYHCHVLPLRATHNRNVISLICLTNGIFLGVQYIFVRAVYLRSNFMLIKHSVSNSSTITC